MSLDSATLIHNLAEAAARHYFEQPQEREMTALPVGAPVYWAELPRRAQAPLREQWANVLKPVMPVIEELLEEQERQAREDAHVACFRIEQFIHELEGRGETAIAAELAALIKD